MNLSMTSPNIVKPTATTICWTAVHLWWKNDQEPELKLNLAVSRQENVAVVHCAGRIVYRDEAAALCSKVTDLLPHAQHIVLDLSQVDAIDGAGLGELLALRAHAQDHGCALTLASPVRLVREVLSLTRLSGVFAVFPTVEAALYPIQAQTA